MFLFKSLLTYFKKICRFAQSYLVNFKRSFFRLSFLSPSFVMKESRQLRIKPFSLSRKNFNFFSNLIFFLSKTLKNLLRGKKSFSTRFHKCESSPLGTFFFALSNLFFIFLNFFQKNFLRPFQRTLPPLQRERSFTLYLLTSFASLFLTFFKIYPSPPLYPTS